MSLETILKNICSFLELLQNARNSNNLNWSSESFQNAFQWAEYCQKIYYQSVGKPYEKQLNEEIKKLNRLSWTLGDLIVDLDLLKNSVGCLSLALIQNDKAPTIDSKLKLILEKAWPNELFKNNLEELVAMNSMFKDISSLEMEIQTDDSFSETCKMEKLKLETSATLLVDYVHKILSLTIYDATVQRMFLRDKLEQLTKSKIGLMILTRAYMILFQSPRIATMKVRQHFQCFVSNLIAKADINFWCSIPRYVIMDLCSTNVEFLKKLFDDLDGLKNNFEVHYHDDIKEDTGRISLFEWRFVSNTKNKTHLMVTSDWLKEWIVEFLDGPISSDVKEKSAEIISRLARASEVNIWRSLCQDLQKIELLID